MLYSPGGTRVYSPKDLVAYLEGDFAAWCERLSTERQRPGAMAALGADQITPDKDEELDLLARMGQEHESRYLDSLRQRESGLVELTRDSPTGYTLRAMQAGAPAIYQAHLEIGDWHGYPDFLVQAAGKSYLGDHRREQTRSPISSTW